jgi:hypothetical protein
MEERLAREGRRRYFWRSWTKPEAFRRTTRRVRREGEGRGWEGGRREKERMGGREEGEEGGKREGDGVVHGGEVGEGGTKEIFLAIVGEAGGVSAHH